ncbi:MAG: ABC transporter permease [Gammaproteobacteria bacterium]|nr:ABC transporter permease [Gammaproteobacteria bacterium]
MDSLRQDLRSSLRYFRHNRGFAAAAVLVLALGIGATTAVFSVGETLLLRPLSYPDGERLVALRSVRQLDNFPFTRAAAGTLADWRLHATSFDAVAGYRWMSVDVIDGARSHRLSGLQATPEFFEVFGVPLEGRAFEAGDRGVGAAVLGRDVWRRLFDGDQALVGGTVDLHVRDLSRVGPTRFTVLGVAAAPVRFPFIEADFELGVATVVDTIDFWLPMFITPTDTREAEDRTINVVAKLRPGVTVARAQAEMDAIASRQAAEHPEKHRGWAVRVVPLRELTPAGARDGIALLSVGAGLLLLIACANVATLLLARGIARRREVAVRTALGADHRRVVRQFLIEAAMLALGAGVVGVVLAAWSVALARPWLPQGLPALQEMAINPTVLGFALISAGVTASITGVAPALRAATSEGVRLTGRDARGSASEGSRRRLVGILVAAEVALTMVLLVGAGLLVRSALRAAGMETGFNSANLLTMTVSLPENKFDWGHNAVFAREVIDAVRSLPSITGAAVVQGVPMSAGGFFGSGVIEGYVPPPGTEAPIYRLRVVSPGYLDTMQIPIVSGREFEPRDEVGERGYNRTILVSESFARRYWPGQDPLGKRIGSLIGAPEWWMTVVGVVGDVRYGGLEAPPTDDVYLPQGLYPQAAITLVARTAGDPMGQAAEVRARIHEIDPHAFVTDVRSMDGVIAASQAERRAGTLLITLFGTLALVLVTAGIYSVITQAVAQRRLELAIRSALGAGPARVIFLTMRTALLPAAMGIGIGTLGAVALTRALSSLLFGVGGFDLATWGSAVAVILTAGLAAGYVPARRAARIDPMTALRAE